MTSIAHEAPAGVPRRERQGSGARREGGAVWLYVVLIIGLILLIGPFIWMLLSSFKETAEIRRIPPTFLPQDPTLDNYRDLLARNNFPRYFLNSTVVALIVTGGNMVFASMLGYALAKLSFPGKRLLFGIVLGMLMVPGIATFIPLYVLVANLGLANTYPGLILPFLAGPFGVFLMRQFIRELPDELLDAARVDGAGEYYIFGRIVMPLSLPALATLGILTFLATWNSFLWPLVVAQSDQMYTLPVALALISVGQQTTNYGLLLAGAVIVVVPVLIVFLALQRYFTKGIAMTGFK